jgi:HSP20 family protein
MSNLLWRRPLGHRPAVRQFDSFFDDIFDGVSSSTPRYFKKSYPAANIRRVDSGYEIDFAIPGVSRSDIDIDIHSQVLTISVTQNSDTDARSSNYVHREFSCNKLSRSWQLPKSTNIEGIAAVYDSGILTVSVPEESNQSESRKIVID